MTGFWIFLSVVCICATFLYWSKKYINPVQDTPIDPTKYEDLEQPANFDKIIAEIYDRLEEE